MEAVARQFAQGKHAMVLRNGWFSYRWTEIFDMGGGGHIAPTHTVSKAVPQPVKDSANPHTHFRPTPVEQVVELIERERPAVLFCPHVETSTGMMLPDDYIKTIADALHKIGGLLVLDCIASGTVWVDMKKTGVDVLISAPQKGWTGAPCAALVMMSELAADVMNSQPVNAETSFSISLKRWTAIMDAYVAGGFAYHTTMPTDALRDFHEVTVETLRMGLSELKEAQLKLGWKSRAILDSKGLTSVAAPGFQAPGVLVYYSPADTANPDMMKAFHSEGLQIAMGVPWKIDEPAGLKTFRIGLFGLDKLTKTDRTAAVMERALDNVLKNIDGHLRRTA
jgi:alanine-glyoxylate transaminase / serine-glyoxylate transaminase / serine-pyruvate transaminase